MPSITNGRRRKRKSDDDPFADLFDVKNPLRCVGVVYDDLKQFCDTVEEQTVLSLVWFSQKLTTTWKDPIGDAEDRLDFEQWKRHVREELNRFKTLNGNEKFCPFYQWGILPINGLQDRMKITRGQRGHALRLMKKKGHLEWKRPEIHYLKKGLPGPFFRYRVCIENVIHRPRSTLLDWNKYVQKYTPVYGWMPQLVDNSDEVLMLAIIFRRWRGHKRRLFAMSNNGVTSALRMSDYAIRKALKSLERKGLISIVDGKPKEVRRIVISEELLRWFKEQQDQHDRYVAYRAKLPGNEDKLWFELVGGEDANNRPHIYPQRPPTQDWYAMLDDPPPEIRRPQSSWPY